MAAKKNSGKKKARTTTKKSKNGKTGCSFVSLLVALAILGSITYFVSRHKGRGETGIGKEITRPKNDKYKVIGIDISHHNGTIKWDKVKEDGVKFAYIKATQGTTHINRRHKKNYDKAKNEGITSGFYHFFMFEKDGAEQAKFFLENSTLEGKDLPPALDVEYSPPSTRRRTEEKYIKGRIREITRFDSVIYEETGIHPVIYTNKECYKDLIKGHFDNNEIWICDLNSEENPNIEEKWVLWQYSHKGKVNGISFDVDMDVFNGTEEDFRAWIETYQ